MGRPRNQQQRGSGGDWLFSQQRRLDRKIHPIS